MRHRQFLLVGLGACVLWLSMHDHASAQQHLHYRVLKYPTSTSVEKFYVTVMGEVGRPGVYEFDQPNISLPQVIELAGGLKEESASRNIYSFRDGRIGPQTFYTQDSPFMVKPGDILAAGRRPDFGPGRSNRQNGALQSVPVELPQVVVLGLIDRPVLLNLPLNAASIPGLFALLRQDRNPERSIAVFPPNGRPFSYAAQNTEPVSLQSGTIVMFDPKTVMRDGLPELPPVANATPPGREVEQTSQVNPSTGPKILLSPVSQANSANPSPATDPGTGSPDHVSHSDESASMDSRSNVAAPKFHFTSRSEVVPTSDPPKENSGLRLPAPSMSAEPASSELKFPSSNETESAHSSVATESSILDEEEASEATEDEGPHQRTEPKFAADSLSIVRSKEAAQKKSVSEFPIWMVMAMTGIGVFCVAGLVVLLRDMQQFKKIVIETRNSQSILDQLVRGELPLHEETVEISHGQHFTARPNPPLRRYREDSAHQAAGEERWVPQPHVSFEALQETVADRSANSMRVDQEDERLPQRRPGRSSAGNRQQQASVSSSTVLDRILSSVNGDRNARRS